MRPQEAAHTAAGRERDTATALRGELDRQRTDAQAEREALRAGHAEQLAQVQRGADERVQVPYRRASDGAGGHRHVPSPVQRS